ncbi:Gfo/Idh/MocA family protein [Paenibacillus sp. CN-4]|uniref:Gfo/Idh/MocA family protein n=1 Tax=Paenibacillus nanchangensis TaxID=3348343 RepID=UPI0039787286
MNKTGAAIIGCGAIYPLHAAALGEMEQAGLLAVVDSDPARAEEAARTYGCEALTDYRALLERPEIEVVHLCTPHYLHAEMAEELLAAGKHVLMEKPLAVTLEAAERLNAAAGRSRAQLGVCFQNRYNNSSRVIKEVAESGRLGRLLCLKGVVTWTRSSDYYEKSPWRGRWATEGGGLLINQTIHTLDLLQWFAGGEPVRVRGSVTTDALEPYIEVEDSAHACFDFADGTRALFYGTNAYLANSPVELELVFEQGTLLQRRDCVYLWRDGEETELSRPAVTSTGAKSYWGVSHGTLIRDFYEHVREGRPFWLNAAEGIKSMRMIHGIYESSRARAGLPLIPGNS